MKLSSPLVDNGDISRDFKISSNGNWVVYRADQDTDGVFELYSVPVGGGTVTKLNGALVSGGDVSGGDEGFQISPDSSRVLYIADQDTNDIQELYSVPIGGGTATKLNTPLVAGRQVYSFIISPDSTRVVYRADQYFNDVPELYSVPIGGGFVSKLHWDHDGFPKGAGGAVISADSRWVIFASNHKSQYDNLYRVLITGAITSNDVIRINPPNSSGGFSYRFSPDGKYFVFSRTPVGLYVPVDYTLYSVLTDEDRWARQLIADLPQGLDLSGDFQVSKDNSRVVFRAERTNGPVAVFSAPASGFGTVTQISGQAGSTWGVTSFKISPDSSRVVYRSDQETNSVFELFSTPIGVGADVKINGHDLTGEHNVKESYQITPDSSQVIYHSTVPGSCCSAIFGVPIGGGTSTQLNPPLEWQESTGFNYGQIHSFSISPNGQSLVFLGNLYTFYTVSGFGLFSVSLVDGSLGRLSEWNGIDLAQNHFLVSPDNARVVYLSDQDPDNYDYELYSVPIEGPPQLESLWINEINYDPYGADAGEFVEIAGTKGLDLSDYQLVLYDGSDGEPYGSPVQLSGQIDHDNCDYGAVAFDTPGLLNDQAGIALAKIGPGGSSLVHFVSYEGAFTGVGGPANGVTSDNAPSQNNNYPYDNYTVQLNKSGYLVREYEEFAWGRWPSTKDDLNNHQHFFACTNPVIPHEVYFSAGNDSVSEAVGTYIVTVHKVEGYNSGDASVQLQLSGTASFSSDYNINTTNLHFLGDATSATAVIFIFDDPDAEQNETIQLTLVNGVEATPVHPAAFQLTLLNNDVGTIPPFPPENIRLNGPLVLGGGIPGGVYEASFRISEDSTRVVYQADQDVDTINEVYSVPIGGGTVAKLNAPLVRGGAVSAMHISPDGSRVVYVADQDVDGVFELYSVPAGGGSATKLNGALVSNGNVEGYGSSRAFMITPDSSRVIYRADQDTDTYHELYSVPLAGGSVTKLNQIVPSTYVTAWTNTPDGSRVVYRFGSELYSVPVAGGTPAKLNGTLQAYGSIWNFSVSDDGATVVYLADQITDWKNELFSVPSVGGTATKLNSELVNGGSVQSYVITPDNVRVIYEADQETDGVDELYSVPVGGGAVTKLSGLMTNGRQIINFQVSPNGSRVVYWADQETQGVYELYSVPVAGGTVTKLNGALVSGGRVQGFADVTFAISPDSSRVVYLADQDTDGVVEIYSVPIEGGPATRLNTPLISYKNVYTFQITPDSSQVIYVADQDIDGVQELYRVPIAGGVVSKINGSMVSGGDVYDYRVGFRISPDSSWVVFMADQGADDVVELYSRQITSTPAPDTDNDGIPDSWESANGLNPLVYNAPSSNLDGDFLTDYEEYIADTVPTNPASFFPEVNITNPPLGQIILVIDPSSSARIYSAYRTTNLAVNPTEWTMPLAEQPGNGSGLTFILTNNVPGWIYRTGVRLP